MSIVGLRYYPKDNSFCRDLNGNIAIIRPCPVDKHPLEEHNEFVIETEPYLKSYPLWVSSYKAIQIRSLQTGKQYEIVYKEDWVQKKTDQYLNISVDSKKQLSPFQLHELSVIIQEDIKNFLEQLNEKTTIHVSIKL